MLDVDLPALGATVRNLLASRGIVPALALLNDRTPYRFTAIYKLNGEVMRAAHAFDRDSEYRTFGELFVIRVAGNVLGNAIPGTLQYARLHLRTPLFVVMGHAGCGAVDAAIASRFHGVAQQSRIEVLLESIDPALADLDATQPHEALLHAAVEANVRHTVRALLGKREVQARLAEGQMKLIGAVYDLESGRVRFLD